MKEMFRATMASRGTVLVPLKSGVVRNGLWIYGSTRQPGLLANRISGELARLSIGLIPGRDVAWRAPMDMKNFEQWLARASDSLGSVITGWVVQLPRDRRRRRFNLLLLDSASCPVGFAKFTMNPANQMSVEVLARFHAYPPSSFWAPSLVLADHVGGYSCVLTTAMPNVPHGPARLTAEQRRAILSEIRERLDDLARPGVAVHGDFAPWNVRVLEHGRVAVVDWEEVGPGVAGADELWYLLSSRRHTQDSGHGVIEEFLGDSFYSISDLKAAAKFWLGRLKRAESSEIDANQPTSPGLRVLGDRVRGTVEQIASSIASL